MCDGVMSNKEKLARQKKAAREIAEIMYASLQQFPEQEQDRRIKEIDRIGSGAAKQRRKKPSKHASTRANSRVRRRVSTLR